MQPAQLLVACAEAVVCAATARRRQRCRPARPCTARRSSASHTSSCRSSWTGEHPPALGPASMAFCILRRARGRRDGVSGEAFRTCGSRTSWRTRARCKPSRERATTTWWTWA
uniref:Uncharacterized protein n=1 Tax=Oryza glumipatula TaxID=40148 RepID=A0A0D9YIS8_9ORYZ